MPADYTPIQAETDKFIAELTQLTTVVDGVVAILNNIEPTVQAAVAAALTADNAADNGSVQAASSAIATVFASYKAERERLAAAAVAGTPNA